MNKELTLEFLDTNITMAYHWLTVNEMVNPAYAIAKYLKDLSPHIENKDTILRIDDIMDDVLRESERLDQDIIEADYNIPQQYETFSAKVEWITTQNLLNFFNAGDFEVGFMYLVELAEKNPDFYENFIPSIKQSGVSPHLMQPLFKYTCLAVDLFGEGFLNFFQGSGFNKDIDVEDIEVVDDKTI